MRNITKIGDFYIENNMQFRMINGIIISLQRADLMVFLG